MHILIISYWDFQQHGMQVTLRTPLHFAQQGHQVILLVHSETTENPARIDDLHPNVEVVRFKLPFRWLACFRGLNRVRQLLCFGIACLVRVFKQYRRGWRPDIIYAAEADAVLIGCMLRRLLGVPLVTRFYGIARITADFDWELKRLGTHGQRNLVSRIALSRHADMIIVTDDGTHGLDVVRAVNPRVKNVRFWRNGGDRPLVSRDATTQLRKACGIKRDDLVLLTVCRLDPMKRVDRAIRALACLREKGVSRAKLVVVGNGPLRSELESLAEQLGVLESVRFVGAVPHTQVYRYYGLADVFLSLYDLSNVGNPLWEALNVGLCIVTLDTGGTREVIVDGVNGRLLAADTDDDTMASNLASALAELAGKPELREKLREGAKAYASEHLWTWEERLKAELDSITELAERAKASRA